MNVDFPSRPHEHHVILQYVKTSTNFGYSLVYRYNKNILKMKNKGFTLAELLIVVAIIAILVAISLPLFSSQIAKANLQADQTHVSAAKAVQ